MSDCPPVVVCAWLLGEPDEIRRDLLGRCGGGLPRASAAVQSPRRVWNDGLGLGLSLSATQPRRSDEGTPMSAMQCSPASGLARACRMANPRLLGRLVSGDEL
jgi:hypothetical protein